jgi:hypothetical protein
VILNFCSAVTFICATLRLNMCEMTSLQSDQCATLRVNMWEMTSLQSDQCAAEPVNASSNFFSLKGECLKSSRHYVSCCRTCQSEGVPSDNMQCFVTRWRSRYPAHWTGCWKAIETLTGSQSTVLSQVCSPDKGDSLVSLCCSIIMFLSLFKPRTESFRLLWQTAILDC